MIKLNKEFLRDKIHACWIGKNIGGTIGGPYEWRQDILDVQGFSSAKGEPLPNDDLDLQLIWLCAMEEMGPYQLTARELAEYWIAYLPPHWNEYGIGKANLKSGILPPLCGEHKNEFWRHSNGAWIRSEIWACLAPGCPEVARRYAFEDAVIDHGMGEGTVAEQFTATMESLAFFRSDLRGILNDALAAIPEDSRVAKSVKFVMDSYDAGKDWKDVRNTLVEMNADLDVFQAPSNVCYVVLGLLYGEGDFKRSLLTAVNCGDDTDCTGATVGAFLGILYGTAGIPQDWADYIGDQIITISIDRSYRRARSLKSCSELTERVLRMIPTVLTANNRYTEWTEGESQLEAENMKIVEVNHARHRFECDRQPLNWPRYCFEAWSNALLRVRAEFDKDPELLAGESVTMTVNFVNLMYAPLHLDIQLHLPEGIIADRASARVYVDHQRENGDNWTVTLTATENIKAINKVIVEAEALGHPNPVLFVVPIIGK